MTVSCQGVVKKENVNIHHVYSLNLQLDGGHERVRQTGSHVTKHDALRLHCVLGVALVWSVSKCAGRRKAGRALTHTHIHAFPPTRKTPTTKKRSLSGKHTLLYIHTVLS